MAVALLIPCALAGLRANSIGTDVSGYAEPLFNLARSSETFEDFYDSGWFRVWRYQEVSGFEIGYVALVWISSKLFGSLQGLLFLSQLLTLLPIFITLLRRSRHYLFFGILVYLLLYFNMSLNMMRQWIAMAYVFMGLVSVYRVGSGLRGNIKCIIPILVGVLFHTSALLGFIVLGIRVFIDAGSSRLYRKVTLVSLIVLVLVVSLRTVSSVLSSLGFGYYVGYLGSQSIELMPNQIILRLPMIVFAVWAFRRTGGKSSSLAFVLCALIVGTLLSQLTSLGEQSGRIGLYFDIYSMLVPALLLDTFERLDSRRLLIGLVLVSYCVVYWLFFYVISGSGETVPYLPFWS